MSDRPISVGDLVQVVKPRLCCGNSSAIGRVFVVGRISMGCYCSTCGFTPPLPCASVQDGVGKCEVERLKRIPPLDELEGERTEESTRLPTKEPA